MRILVTGACGFVGRYLCQALVSAGHSVVGTVHPETKNQVLDIPTRALKIEDQASLAEIFRKEKLEALFHLAAVSFVPQAEKNFQLVSRSNIDGVQSVASTCAEFGAKLVLVSSGEVYGKVSQNEGALTEEHAPAPANLYALSKHIGEQIVEYYRREKGLCAVIARPFNHIGPGQRPDFVVPNFALQVSKIIKGEVPPVLKVGNLEAIRDFLDVRDVVQAYLHLLSRNEGVWNISSGKGVSIQHVLNRLLALADRKIDIEVDPSRMRPSENPKVIGSSEKLQQATGWQPKISLDQSLTDILESWTTKDATDAKKNERFS